MMATNNPKEKKLIRNTIWYSIGTFSSRAISFLLVPLYTGILTKSQYSVSDLISTTVSLSLPFFSLIISSAVFRFVIEKKENYDKILSFGLFVILAGYIPLVFISRVVFCFIDSLYPYWYYFIIIYLITAISTLESEFLKGQERVKIVTLVDVIHTLTFVTCNIVFLVLLKWEIKGFLFSQIICGTVSVLLYFVVGKIYKYISNPKKVEKDIRKKMLQYSIPLIPNSAMWWITNSSDRYFVAFMISISANGLLSVSYKIPSVLSVFISVFHSAWELSVVDDFDNEKGKNFFKNVYQFYIECNIIIVSFLVFSSKILGRILYAGDFFEAWKMSAVLILGFSFHAIAGFLGSAFTAAKETKKLFTSTLVAAIVNLILNYLLIKSMGAVGAVVATVASYFALFIIRYIAVSKYVDINQNILRNTIAFCLVVCEVVLVYSDTSIGFVCALIILLCLLFYNRRPITFLINKILSRLT